MASAMTVCTKYYKKALKKHRKKRQDLMFQVPDGTEEEIVVPSGGVIVIEGTEYEILSDYYDTVMVKK
jgi:hypothetical protein